MLEIKTYKNWKEICKIMGWNSKNGGNYKKSKLKELESICLYHKEGNKYIIDEIYDIKKDIYDGRVNNKGGNNSIYADSVDKLILNLCSKLYDSEYNYIELSPSILMEKLKMSNKNFIFGRNNINKFSRWSEIPVETIYDFYNSTYKKNKDIIESSLNRFYKKSLIDFDKEVVKVCTTEREYRRATDNEREMIKELEQEIFEELGYEDKKDVFLHSEWNKFKEMKSKYLKNFGILYDFKVYHIITTKKFRKMLLDEKEKDKIENKLNLDIQNSAEKSAIKRHNNTINKYTKHFDFGKDKFIEPYYVNDRNRCSENYVDDTKKVIALCIDKNSKIDFEKAFINIKNDKYTFIEDLFNKQHELEELFV